MMEVEPIADSPALIVEDALVIADLHLGIELEYRKKGVYVEKQSVRLAKDVANMAEEYGIRKVIVIGDIKHMIGCWESGINDVKAFYNVLSSRGISLHLIPGNHDGGLYANLGGKIYFLPPRGVVYKGVAMVHGHAWPSHQVMDADILIMGHLHPAIELRDGMGSIDVVPCWVRARVNADILTKYYEGGNDSMEVIIIPAFNPLIRGVCINTEDYHLGPLLSSGMIDVKDGDVHLLDGAYLGKVSNLRYGCNGR